VAVNQLDLLLSLDIALQLIHADRESLKRVETFVGFPGHYGFRVRDSIEELFILLLRAIADRHVEKGFSQCVRYLARALTRIPSVDGHSGLHCR
jgi:recyclin-1